MGQPQRDSNQRIKQLYVQKKCDLISKAQQKIKRIKVLFVTIKADFFLIKFLILVAIYINRSQRLIICVPPLTVNIVIINPHEKTTLSVSHLY